VKLVIWEGGTVCCLEMILPFLSAKISIKAVSGLFMAHNTYIHAYFRVVNASL